MKNTSFCPFVPESIALGVRWGYQEGFKKNDLLTLLDSGGVVLASRELRGPHYPIAEFF